MTAFEGFDGSGPPQPPDTTILSTLLPISARKALKLLRTAMPARVTAVRSDNRADIQPGFQSVYRTQTAPVTLPIVSDVPVLMPQGQSWAVTLPVAVGDTGLLLVLDRALHPWLAGDGGPQNPADLRLHDITDSIFVPGLLTDAAAAGAPPSNGDVVVRNGAATLRVQARGTYKISNEANELVALIQQLADAAMSLASATRALTVGAVALPNGSIAFNAAALGQLNAAASKLSPLAARIGTLKGK